MQAKTVCIVELYCLQEWFGLLILMRGWVPDFWFFRSLLVRKLNKRFPSQGFVITFFFIMAVLLFFAAMYKVTIEAQQSKPNPFKAPLLSELFIELPKPLPPSRSPSRHIEVHPYTDYHDLHGSNMEQQVRHNEQDSISPVRYDGSSWFGGSSKTKNSSSAATCRSESEIIMEWVKSLFHKRGLLGPHWEEILRDKRRSYL